MKSSQRQLQAAKMMHPDNPLSNPYSNEFPKHPKIVAMYEFLIILIKLIILIVHRSPQRNYY